MPGEFVAEVKDLSVRYTVPGGMWGKPASSVHAVNGVSLTLRKGEVLGLVGESGCGKSSLGRAIIRLVEPSNGSVYIGGNDFLSLRGEKLRSARQSIQMVFQDPYASLDPRMNIFDTLAEPLRAHKKMSAVEIEAKIHSTLGLVGLPVAAAKKYPHEFSGGQRQRVAIGRALILDPKVIIADEPVSSLDVSVQAQILNLLKEIQQKLGLSLLFISHNLAVVRYISDRIAVMYLGQIVETADSETLYRSPQHPYTKALLSAVPVPDPRIERTRKTIALQGEIPSKLEVATGCCFASRCPIAMPRCSREKPLLEGQAHKVACYYATPEPSPEAKIV
jgi:oligopeptide transport system ATP-binding protein